MASSVPHKGFFMRVIIERGELDSLTITPTGQNRLREFAKAYHVSEGAVRIFHIGPDYDQESLLEAFAVTKAQRRELDCGWPVYKLVYTGTFDDYFHMQWETEEAFNM